MEKLMTIYNTRRKMRILFRHVEAVLLLYFFQNIVYLINWPFQPIPFDGRSHELKRETTYANKERFPEVPF